MDDTTGSAGTASTTTKPKRGKEQLPWDHEVWHTLDQAVLEEITRSRICAKFLQQAYVHKKRVNVDSDQVIVPTPSSSTPPSDPALSVDETQTTRIQEYSVQFKLTPAQVEAEGNEEKELVAPTAADSASASASTGQATINRPHRASTAMSLAQRASNILVQAEDGVILGGQNFIANSPLVLSGQVTPLDQKLGTTLDNGLLHIASNGTMDINSPANTSATGIAPSQVIVVHPTVLGSSGAAPLYRENTLNAIASGVSVLQGLGHYEGYAVVLHTVPYADLHQALPSTLITPVQPLTSIIKSGIYGTGGMPPYVPITLNDLGKAPSAATTLLAKQSLGLPTSIPSVSLDSDKTLFLAGAPGNPSALKDPSTAAVLYTGVIVSLAGNTMDLVRGQMDDGLDVSVTFNQKDATEAYRFRAVQRLAFRLKLSTASVTLLFVDC